MKTPINTDRRGLCKTIYGRMGRLSWENYLGRMENGGWDTQMTCIMEIDNGSDSGDGWHVEPEHDIEILSEGERDGDKLCAYRLP